MAKWQIVLAGLVGGAAVIGGGAAYLFFKGIPAIEGTNPVASARIVPDEALFAGYVSGDIQTWSKLKKFGTPAAQQLFAKDWKKLLSTLDTQVLEGQALEFEDDVLPWLGSIMLAAIPNEAGPPQRLLVVGIQDKAAALGFANQIKGQGGATVRETDYQGVKVLEITPEAADPVFIGILEHHLAVADQRAVVEAAIDTSQGEPSLASITAGQELIGPSVDLKNPVFQFFVPNYEAFAQTVAGGRWGPLAPVLGQQQPVKSVAIGVGIDEQGMRLRSRYTLPDGVSWRYTPIPDTVVAKFPANTMVFMSGSGINQQWAALVDQLEQQSEIKRGIEFARQQLRRTAQLDLDKDVFGWMDGEFALALIPSQQGLLSGTGFGGAVVLTTSDRNTAEGSLSKLDQLATGNRFLQLGQREIGGTPVTEWQIPNFGGVVSRGWLDAQTTFLVLGSPLAEVVAAPPSSSLQDSDIFQAATAGLPKKNAGYLYINMEQATQIMANNRFAESLIPTPLQSILQTPVVEAVLRTPELQELINSMQGIGAATTQVNDTTYQSDIVVTLKPNG